MKKLLLITVTIVFLLNFSSCSLGNPFSRAPRMSPTPQSTISPKDTPTSPAPSNTPTLEPTEETFRFVVMADSRGSDKGINTVAIKKTLERIKQLAPQPEFAVMPGDLCGGDKSSAVVKSQMEYFKDTVTQYYPLDFFYPGLGNHEAIAGLGGESAFSQVFSTFTANFLEGYNRTVYYFDRSNTRFFMLNSNHPGETHKVSDTQLTWLKANIDPSKKHNLFFMHEPAYPTGPHIGSSLDAYPKQRDMLWSVIDSVSGPMVFCGHEHFYTRRHIGTELSFSKLVYQVTTGSFGAPLYTEYKDKRNVDVPPVPQYHFAVVDISGDKISVRVYNLEGTLIDEFKQE